MEAAGKEEAVLAIKAGDLCDPGIPIITVITDGDWCKRSFGSNYNALLEVMLVLGKFYLRELYMHTAVYVQGQEKKLQHLVSMPASKIER
ncbi:hypothetical protein PR048_014992 [Dryococelus australis]|uniref:Uncharacterized protein n=1 Tax=Dryococelus australis TaxID=614101 RepID=A0ABQ9HFR5_9NEOP|nr:hypothetical protein PR048_014992 [Dryococelus australis]